MRLRCRSFGMSASPRAVLIPEGCLAGAGRACGVRTGFRVRSGKDGCLAMPFTLILFNAAQANMAFAPRSIGATAWCYSHWAGVAINTRCGGVEIQPYYLPVLGTAAQRHPVVMTMRCCGKFELGHLLVSRFGLHPALPMPVTQSLLAGLCPRAGAMSMTWSWGASYMITVRRSCDMGTA